MPLSRRSLLLTALLAPTVARAADNPVAALEHKHGGRLGVTILDTGSGRRIEHRADERFAMCSTFKLLAAACVLKRVDDGRETLARRIAAPRGKLASYSPATSKHIGSRMTLNDLCIAAVTLSDNTAANLILETIGGPPGVTAFARAIGDSVTRLDRNEPALNEAKPGDPRDTTTPAAMAGTVRALVLSDALSAPSRETLTGWLAANKTGDTRLRAGLPQGWRVGDKTGTGPRGIANDIGVVWPPDRAPLVITAYYESNGAAGPKRDAVLAAVGRIAAEF